MHPDLGCLRLAERRRAFSRALRFAGTLDSAAVRTFLAEQAGDATSPRSAVDVPDAWNRPGARSTQRAGRPDMYPQP